MPRSTIDRSRQSVRRTVSGRVRAAAAAAVAATVALALVACAGAGADGGNASGYRGKLLYQPRQKVDFTLTDTGGRPFHFRKETDGYVTLVFFGYTHCPDVCPIQMANIGAVMKGLPFELRRQFRVIFITTDPERDPPERLREWLDNFDRDFIGLTGSPEETNAIASSLGLPPAVKIETEDGGYAVRHSANVLVFTRDNLAHIRYPAGTRQADWAHDLPRLAKETW